MPGFGLPPYHLIFRLNQLFMGAPSMFVLTYCKNNLLLDVTHVTKVNLLPSPASLAANCKEELFSYDLIKTRMSLIGSLESWKNENILIQYSWLWILVHLNVMPSDLLFLIHSSHGGTYITCIINYVWLVCYREATV